MGDVARQGSMGRYIVRRILQAIPTFFLAITIVFLLTRLAPGDVVPIIAGELATEEYRAEIIARLGLDQPLYVQYLFFLASTLQGDLGKSFVFNEPIITLILQRLPATLLLICTSTLISYAGGLLLGVISSRKPASLLDNTVTTLTLVSYSVPMFWMGMLLIIVLSYMLGIFPSHGMIDMKHGYTGLIYITDLLHHLVLPAFTLSLHQLALVTRLTRRGMLETFRLDFVTTARSKGLPERTILYRHVLRNALLPVVTILGVYIGMVITGTVLVETVFAWPGIGRLVFDAINKRDYPTITGTFVFISLFVVVIALIVDIVYAYLDPRVKYGGK